MSIPAQCLYEVFPGQRCMTSV